MELIENTRTSLVYLKIVFSAQYSLDITIWSLFPNVSIRDRLYFHKSDGYHLRFYKKVAHSCGCGWW
jgi:hypothetical protein